MNYGTCHFFNFTAACDYYRGYNPESTPAKLEAYVRQKIDEGAIEIGAPDIKPGQTLQLDADRRYIISEA